MFKKVKLNKKKKGFTLIEILLVVGFIALAGIGVYVVYEKVQATHMANQEIKNINTIIAGTKSIFNATGQSSGTLTQQNLIQLGVVPENMLDRNTDPISIKNSLGDRVTLDSSNINYARVTYRNVPKDVCVKMISGMVPSVLQINVIPGGSGFPVSAYSKTLNVPFNVATVAARCSGSRPLSTTVSPGNATIEFIFGTRDSIRS